MPRHTARLVLAAMAVLGHRVRRVARVAADFLVVHDQVVGVLLSVDALALHHYDLVHMDRRVLVHVGGTEQAPALFVARFVGHRDVRAVEAHLGALALTLLTVGMDVHA
jgi:hypothetical protein